MNTIHSCGIKINPISVDEVISLTDKWMENGDKGIQITGINLEQIALLSKNPHFRDFVNSSDIVNIDGMIVYWYLKLKGYKIQYRTLCADILLKMLANANQRKQKIYLLGAEQDTIERLVSVMNEKYPDIIICGFHNGFFKDEKIIVSDISEKKPDYLFIGMPSPFKERFISTYKKQLNTGVCFGVGGMFDILAGKVQRAPEKVQKLGIEWLYRITQNPVGHSKRIMRALLPCLKVFAKNLFEKRKQEF